MKDIFVPSEEEKMFLRHNVLSYVKKKLANGFLISN
jgi:hypothetical protein